MLRCSFCNHTEKEVKKLVAGPNVYICDDCVKIATQIINSPEPPTARKPTNASIVARVWRRLLGRAEFVRA